MITNLDYFQIASVVMAILIFTGRALYLLTRRNINPIALGRGKRGFLLAFELTAFAGLLIWISEVMLRALHCDFSIFPSQLSAQLFDSFPAQVFGVVMVALGLVLFALAFVSFGDSWRVGFDVKTPGPLVTKGIFAVSRNPIYLFLDFWFVGIFLITGLLLFFIFAVAAILILHWQIHQEEHFLLQLYGQPYREYLDDTGRYLVW